MLVTTDVTGAETRYVLASRRGGPVNAEVAPFAAEAVEVRGRLVRRGDLQVLHVDPAEIRRR